MQTQTCAYVRFPATVSEQLIRVLIKHALDCLDDDLEFDGFSEVDRQARAIQAANPKQSPDEVLGLDLCSIPAREWGDRLREFVGCVVLGEGCTTILIGQVE